MSLSTRKEIVMQIVVVKAPKLLRGILRAVFKMKKPESTSF